MVVISQRAAVKTALCSRHTLRHRSFQLGFGEALHGLGQLRVHLVRDNHDIRQKQAEVQHAQVLMQCSEDRHLKDS